MSFLMKKATLLTDHFQSPFCYQDKSSRLNPATFLPLKLRANRDFQLVLTWNSLDWLEMQKEIDLPHLVVPA